MEAVAIRSVADMPSPFVTVVPVEQQVSPDGRWAAVVSPVSPWEQRVQLVDVATGAVLAADVASVAACYWLPAAD